jgi:hypothetical protein
MRRISLQRAFAKRTFSGSRLNILQPRSGDSA